MREIRRAQRSAFGPDGRLYFTDSGDWAPDAKRHSGRIVVVEKNGTAKVIEELDHVYPNGIVVEPDGSVVWVESYTLKVVRRSPDGAKQVIHTTPKGHIPTV
jgi:gluconolactonase